MVMKKHLAAWGVVRVVLSACSAGGPTGSEAGCLDSIELAGNFYIERNMQVSPERVRETLPGAVQPACNDTDGSNAKDRPITIHRLDGVDPAVAVLSDLGRLYVRHGTEASLLPGWLGIEEQPSRIDGRALQGLTARGSVSQTR